VPGVSDTSVYTRSASLLHVELDGIHKLHLVTHLPQDTRIAARATAHVEDARRRLRKTAAQEIHRAEEFETSSWFNPQSVLFFSSRIMVENLRLDLAAGTRRLSG
jgi:hypothetical protein